MATAKLYSIEQGKIVAFDLEADQNGEIVASYGNEVLKFPGGLTKPEFLKLVKQHNEANEGIVALDLSEIEARDKKNQKLLDSLE